MRRSPLARGSKSLARRTRLRPRRPQLRRSSRVHDPDYRAAVRTLPCDLRDLGGCQGASEASHLPEQGKRGLGMKCSDSRCVPHCRAHHAQWEERRGFFEGWTKEERGEYADLAIARTQAALLLGAGVTS